jgi:Tfp pilus assembly protein PilZ
MDFLKRQQEKRQYMRHPAEIPVEYKISGDDGEKTDITRNISFGGLCFQTHTYIEPGTMLVVKFPSINPKVDVKAKIVWCSRKKGYTEIGAQFLDENDAYRARIIEEICDLKNRQLQSIKEESI